MNKKIIKVLSLLLILGIILIGVSFLIDKKDLNTNNSSLSNKMELGEFSDIVVDVIAADIKIQSGDTFSVSYQLNSKEKIDHLEIIDGTLYFITKMDIKIGKNWSFHTNKKIINITVPKEIDLNNLDLSTVDGNIEIDDSVMNIASLNCTSGNIKLNRVKAKEVNSEVVSGVILINESNIIDVKASGKSTDISFDGSFDNVDINTVSGDCNIKSSTIKNFNVKNVSGDIEVVTPKSGVSANSYGKIYYLGKKQGRNFNIPDNDTMLTLSSYSGKIDIEINSNE